MNDIHPQAIDEATRAAVAALAHRVRARDTAEPAERADPEPFALEFLVALRGQGWRPTAARPPEPWQHPGPPPAPDTYPRGAAAARRVLAGHDVDDDPTTTDRETT